MSLFIFILILVALIWVHELGHFAAAKLFRIRVDEFAIGFPPRLFRLRLGETDYTFNLLLIGGFVKIYGEDPSSSAEATQDKRALSSRSRGVQALVVAAGITMNLLFAWVLLSAGYMYGLPTSAAHEGFGTVANPQPMIVGVLPDSPAQKAGLVGGDVVVGVETGSARLEVASLSTERQADAVRAFIAAHPDESMVLTVNRDGGEKTFLAKPVEGLSDTGKVIGIHLDDIGVLALPPHLALLQGALAAKNMTVQTAQGLGAFLAQVVGGSANFSQVAGPIGIAGAGAAAVNEGFAAAIIITALISVNLAIINIVPIPGLDGGRLLILAIEGVKRSPISQRFSTGLTLAGFAFLLILIILVSAHDIARLIG